jgi:DNA helicase HerA-like ATPase
MAELLLEGEGEALTRRAIELALEGDMAALKLCLERILPQRRSRRVIFDLPPIDRIEDLGKAIGSVLQEAASGQLFLDEAAALIGMMEARRKALETIDLEQRLQALEADLAQDEGSHERDPE